MSLQRICSLTLALVLTVPAWARKPGDPIKPGWNLFSKEQDVQLGQEAAAQIRQQVKIADNQELQSYFQRIGKRLSSQPEADKYPYTFTVIVDKSINAFALPGGPTFMHHGLLLAADNEAQVAGVVAHEIAHVALRHSTNQMTKANFVQIPAILAGVVTGSNLLGQLAQLGGTAFLLKFSRSAETQADLVGAKMMANAGYNPLEMARFFEKLEAEGGSRAPEFLSSHPNPGNRIKSIEEELRAFPRQSYTRSEGDFARMKQLAQQLPATTGRQPAPGRASTEAPVPRISGGYKQAQGRGFAFSYPDNWDAYGDRDAASMTVAPREGVVQSQSGGTAIGYGVMVSYFVPDNGRRDVSQMTSRLIERLRGSNPSLRAGNQRQRRMRVDGSNAILTQLLSESPYGGQTEVDLLLTIERPEGLFYMIMISPERHYGEMEPVFNQILKSIRFSA